MPHFFKLFFRAVEPEPAITPVQVTDGLPRIGPRTLIVAIPLALTLAFGVHLVLKSAMVLSFPEIGMASPTTAGSPTAHSDTTAPSVPDSPSAEILFPSVVISQFKPLSWNILESPLFVKIPPLKYGNFRSELYTSDPPAFEDRVGLTRLVPAQIASYFSSDVSVVQVYLRFVSACGKNSECQKELLQGAYEIVSQLKHNPLYILYRLQSGYIQLLATYVFSIGLLVLLLRGLRADWISTHLASSSAGETYAKDWAWPDELPSLSFKDTMKHYWNREIEGKSDAVSQDIRDQLQDFGMVCYEPPWPTPTLLTKLGARAVLLRSYQSLLAYSLRPTKQIRDMNARGRFSLVLPRTIFKVISAFAVDQAQFPMTARKRASEALEHSVDEVAAVIAADRDLYSRLVELTPVVGFFGTVWGLSLAMLGANDVIRAQDSSWNYDVANNVTYLTAVLGSGNTDKQQFALQGMLSALSIKFDTTGYALILMFFLILFGARGTRREYRALSFLHSVVNESLLSVLPSFGALPTAQASNAPKQPLPQSPPPSQTPPEAEK